MNNNVNFKLNCSESVRNILIEALHTYASLICPEPSSQTNEETKQAILDTVNFLKDPSNNHFIPITLNLYSQFRSAINFHYDRIRKELNTSVDKQKMLILNAINGDEITDHSLDEAILKDQLFN